MRHTPIHRRTFLRGMGTALALPWLDAMAWAEGQAPKRLAFVFIPNGVHFPDWTPRDVGRDYVLPHMLDPLVAYKEDFTVLDADGGFSAFRAVD